MRQPPPFWIRVAFFGSAETVSDTLPPGVFVADRELLTEGHRAHYRLNARYITVLFPPAQLVDCDTCGQTSGLMLTYAPAIYIYTGDDLDEALARFETVTRENLTSEQADDLMHGLNAFGGHNLA